MLQDAYVVLWIRVFVTVKRVTEFRGAVFEPCLLRVILEDRPADLHIHLLAPRLFEAKVEVAVARYFVPFFDDFVRDGRPALKDLRGNEKEAFNVVPLERLVYERKTTIDSFIRIDPPAPVGFYVERVCIALLSQALIFLVLKANPIQKMYFNVIRVSRKSFTWLLP